MTKLERLKEKAEDAEDVIIAGYKAEEFTITMPELSLWKCHLFGDNKGYGITYKPQKGGEPNWFWRMTQHLILGHKWVKGQDNE